MCAAKKGFAKHPSLDKLCNFNTKTSSGLFCHSLFHFIHFYLSSVINTDTNGLPYTSYRALKSIGLVQIALNYKLLHSSVTILFKNMLADIKKNNYNNRKRKERRRILGINWCSALTLYLMSPA